MLLPVTAICCLRHCMKIQNLIIGMCQVCGLHNRVHRVGEGWKSIKLRITGLHTLEVTTPIWKIVTESRANLAGRGYESTL